MDLPIHELQVFLMPSLHGLTWRGLRVYLARLDRCLLGVGALLTGGGSTAAA